MLQTIYKKYLFDIKADRIGPDILFTHWKLHFKMLMLRMCFKKFKYFHPTADFRPGAYAVTCSKISLGKNVTIRPGTMLFAYPMGRHGTITIHDDALIGSGVHFYTANHSFRNFDKKIIEQGHDEPADIILMDGCWIGANVILLPGVTIGRNTVVGAGSVVTKSLPDNSVAVGNPARVIRTLHRGNMHN